MAATKENRDIRKQFLLDKTTAAKLKALAENKGMSENEIVMRSIQSYLKRFSFPVEVVGVISDSDIMTGDPL